MSKTIEQQSKVRGTKISEDKLLGESDYAEIQRQSLYKYHTLALCPMADLSAWDRNEDTEKNESFIKVIQGQKDPHLFLKKTTFNSKYNGTNFRN